MKFGKEFKKQKVPEWTEAYVDYNGLKRILQDIQRFRQSKQPPTPLRTSQQRLALYRPFSGLDAQAGHVKSPGDIEDQVIAVNTVQRDDSRKLYNTKFLMSPEEGGESEITFFEKLDEELNKVNTFYKDKVEEVIEEAVLLNKQMDALIALRIKVEKPDFDGRHSLRQLSMDIDKTEPLRITSPSTVELVGEGTRHMDERHGVEIGNRDQPRDSSTSLNENGKMDLRPDVDRLLNGRPDESGDPINAVSTANSSDVCRKEENFKEFQPHLLEVLDRVKISNTLESPMSTIKSVLNDSKEMDLSFNKEELREVEGRLKLVFIEFYRKLHLLRHYSFMNLSAFSKILKKYEKIALRSAARSYMKIVDNSYIGSSEEVTALLDRVEATFITYFSNSNRREGMKLLRPKRKRERHRITFFSGFFSGCSIALLVAVVLLIHSRKVMVRQEHTLYMENIFPLYSLYAYVVLHMLLYAANIYFWRRYRINYPFIFGFKQGTEVSYQDVFLVSTGLAVLALATFLIHLHMKMDSRIEVYDKYIELVPLGLVIVLLAIIFCPFSVVYRSSRFFLIQCVFLCICAPLYKVSLPDFFMADQLTSQIQALRSLEFYICYYGLNGYQKRKKCHRQDLYNIFYFIVAVIPYWMRFLQCLRRLFEERDLVHIYNSSRYFLTIVAVVIRTAFELKKGKTWKVLAFVSSGVATLMNTYWDIVMDWGLLQRKSKNLFLRDKLVVSHRSVYFAAMVLDVVLRFAWLQLVLKFNVHSLHGTAISSLFSCLEIFRRGMWNFFRLENEHLNNVGKYRAFKSVPLPFNYYEDNTDKDD